MAKISCCFWSVLLLLCSCHSRVPETGISADSTKLIKTDSGTFIVDTVPGTKLPEIIEVDTPAQRTVITESPALAFQPSVQKKIYPSITDVYLSQVGVREKTGHNDGRDVEKYLNSVGLGKGYAWCAAFVRWCFDSAGIRTKINGAASSAHNSKDLVWFHRTQLKIPEAGDVFTLWFASLGRIGHTGFFHSKINSSVYESIEGNTNEAGSREGDGVYKKYRSFNATYSISRWTKN